MCASSEGVLPSGGLQALLPGASLDPLLFQVLSRPILPHQHCEREASAALFVWHRG